MYKAIVVEAIIRLVYRTFVLDPVQRYFVRFYAYSDGYFDMTSSLCEYSSIPNLQCVVGSEVILGVCAVLLCFVAAGFSM